MADKLREIVEEEPFSRQVQKLGGAIQIDAALDPIVEALARRPEGFPTIPEWEPLRLAKTYPLEEDDDTLVPALRVWFRIDGETVYLMYVEPIPD